MPVAQTAASLRLKVLRKQVQQCHAELDEGAAPSGHKPRTAKLRSARVRLYLHALCIEDITIQSLVREAPPLFTYWPDLVGRADVVAIRRYARAVHAATDAYLQELPAQGLDRELDLRKLGLGRRSVVWVIRRFVAQELGHIHREILFIEWARGADCVRDGAEAW